MQTARLVVEKEKLPTEMENLGKTEQFIESREATAVGYTSAQSQIQDPEGMPRRM